MCGVIEAIGAGASLIGGLVGREGADDRRDRSAGVRREVLGAAQNYLDNNQTYQLGRTGGQAAENLGGLIGADGRDPTETLMETPGYQFRYNEGLDALSQRASLAGGLYSGKAMKEAQRYGQNFASNEFQNAFNRNYALVNGANQAGAQALGVQANAWGKFWPDAGSGAAGQNRRNARRGERCCKRCRLWLWKYGRRRVSARIYSEWRVPECGERARCA